jgi:hypothetical protein
MVKKVGVSVFVLLLCIMSLSMLPVNRTMAESAPMSDIVKQTFDLTGATAEGYGVYAFSEINRTFLSMNKLEEMAASLNRTLSIRNPQTYRVQDGSQNLYQIYGVWAPDTKVSLVITSTNFTGHQPQTTLVIRVEKSSQDIADLPASIQTVRDTVSQTSKTPQISTCINGFSNDRMDSMGRNDLFSKILRFLKLEERETIRSDGMTIISGYSPRSQEYSLVGGKKTNIQIILRDDASKRKTQIIVGTPIVSTE